MAKSARIIKTSSDQQTKLEQKEVRKMRIRTVYSLNGKKTHEFKAFYASNAAPNAMRNMQHEEFDADLVEVYSLVTGKLFLVMTREITGELITHVHEKIKKGE